MTGHTSNRSYPYPQTSDSYVPTSDIQALATAVDVDVEDFRHDVIGTPVAATSAGPSFSATSPNTLIDTITVSLVSGRRYKVIARIPWVGGTLNDEFFLVLCEDSSTGTQMDFTTVRVTDTSRTRTSDLWAYFTAGATASKTFVSAGRRASGSGGINIGGSANGKRYLTVETAY